MNGFKNMPFAGVVVIIVIALLFALAVLLLFYTFFRYKRLAYLAGNKQGKENGFARTVLHLVSEMAEGDAGVGEGFLGVGEDRADPGVVRGGGGGFLHAVCDAEQQFAPLGEGLQLVIKLFLAS